MNFKNKTIAVIGLGYVGLPLAVEFGRIRQVIGFDIDTERIEELKRGTDRTLEITADELSAAKHLVYTSDLEGISEAQIYIVTVPTPVDGSNRPDFSALIKASESVASVLKPGDIVIYESTVYPGATEEICVPVLESKSGLSYIVEDAVRSGVQSQITSGFYCGYSPERINPGDKNHRLKNIQKITSGSTTEAAEAVDGLYSQIIDAGTFRASSIKVAEAAKVIENAQRDLNIAFVNELSIIFNKMGLDTGEILSAANTKWNFIKFKPGLVGGHCIGVDPFYLTFKAEALGYQPQVILAGRRVNDGMAAYAAREIVKLMLANKLNLANSSVGVLGVTFKEDCPDMRNSKVIDLIRELKIWGLSVKVWDPLARNEEVYDALGQDLEEISPDNTVDALVFAVAHSSFKNYSLDQIMRFFQAPPFVLADLKSMYDQKSLKSAGFKVFRL